GVPVPGGTEAPGWRRTARRRNLPRPWAADRQAGGCGPRQPGLRRIEDHDRAVIMKGRPWGAIVLGAIALAFFSTGAGPSEGPPMQPNGPAHPVIAPDPVPAPSPVPANCERHTLIGTVAVSRVAARTGPSRSAR